MNINKDSTTDLLELGSEAGLDEDLIAVTEIDKKKGFNLGRSIDSQMQVVDKIPFTPDTHFSTEKSVMDMEMEFIEKNISNLSRAKLSFGFVDSQKYSRKTQRWEGHILEIKGESFVGKLEDLSNPGTYEIAEFNIYFFLEL